jgi:hypothetical protein
VWAPGTARSMRRTEAPQSASSRPANGPVGCVVSRLNLPDGPRELTWS